MLGLAALGVVFWILHPHAWAYLAALPTPFLALAAARAVSPRAPEVDRPGARRSARPRAPVRRWLAAADGPPPCRRGRADGSGGRPLARRAPAPLARGSRARSVGHALLRVTLHGAMILARARRLLGSSGKLDGGTDDGHPTQCTLALNSYRLAVLPEQTAGSSRGLRTPRERARGAARQAARAQLGDAPGRWSRWRASGESLRIGSLAKEPWAER